jgi:hypothetical protein
MSATKHKAREAKLTRLLAKAQQTLEKSQKAQADLANSLKALADAWQEHCQGEGNGESHAHPGREDAEETQVG